MEKLIEYMIDELGYSEDVAREVVEKSQEEGLLDVPIHIS